MTQKLTALWCLFQNHRVKFPKEATLTDKRIPLREADHVKIAIVVDNSIDVLMSGTEAAQRMILGPNPFQKPLPIAQHGFSALIRVKRGDRQGTALFHTGVSREGILYNLDALEIPAGDIQAVILSHGHPDHAMGLRGLIDRLGSRNLPLVLHPDAYLERKLILPNGYEIALPAPKHSDLRRENIQMIEEVDCGSPGSNSGRPPLKRAKGP